MKLQDYMTLALAGIGAVWLIHAVASLLCNLITLRKNNGAGINDDPNH